MDGEYPAAQNPDKNLPINIIGRFWDDAIRIQPIKSGMAIITNACLLPNFDPKSKF